MSRFSDADIERRKKLWTALSDLWIDTELQDFQLDHIARVMRDSFYTLAEMREIYLYEVAPVVWRNLASPVPPVWTGFDEDWLHAEILRRLGRSGRLRRALIRLMRRPMTYASDHDWDEVVRRYQTMDASEAGGPEDCGGDDGA